MMGIKRGSGGGDDPPGGGGGGGAAQPLAQQKLRVGEQPVSATQPGRLAPAPPRLGKPAHVSAYKNILDAARATAKVPVTAYKSVLDAARAKK